MGSERSGARRLMGQVFDLIRSLVDEGKYVVGKHAAERLEERGILEWQAVAGLEDGILLIKRPDATPNSAVEVRESLPDGTEFKAVWSLTAAIRRCEAGDGLLFRPKVSDANPGRTNQGDATGPRRSLCRGH